MRVYIATKWENREEAQSVAAALEMVGHVITCPWWLNEQMTPEQAQADVKGVMTADALLLLVEKDYQYKGALVEFGIAIALDIPIYVVGHAIDSCIFLLLPQVVRGGYGNLLESGV